MNESTEAPAPADCMTVTEARLRMALIEQALAFEAFEAIRQDLAEIAAGATVH